MKKSPYILILTLIIAVLSFNSCLKLNSDILTTETTESQSTVYVFEPYSTEAATEYEETSVSEMITTEIFSQVSEPPMEIITDESTVAPTREAVTENIQTTTENKTTEHTTTVQEDTTVDLSVELPDANGKIYVDTSASNKFTATVANERKVDTELLAAVYSVPASGQNYVLEFYSGKEHTADNLRRVYLLDDNCKITSVAAAKSSEKENISSTENWFCFNVLIKGVIFDAVAEDLN